MLRHYLLLVTRVLLRGTFLAFISFFGIALLFHAVAGTTGWPFSGRHMNFRILAGDSSLRVRADGNVDLAPDGSGVTGLGGGSFDVSLRRNGFDRRVLFTSANGAIVRQFFVEGDEQPWGPGADRFLADVMPIVLRETAINARERVAWILANRGHDGLIDEIALISSDFAQRIYTVEYAKVATISAADFDRLMALAREDMRSDFDLRATLIEVYEEQRPTGEPLAAWLEAASAISSDFDMRLALHPLVTSAQATNEYVARALNLAGAEILSDFDLRTLLAAAAERVGRSDALAQAYLTATRSIGSDFDQRKALSALARDADLTPDGWRLLLRAATAISSDFDAATLLVEIAPILPDEEGLVEAYRETLETISSDFEYGRAARALRRAGGTLDSQTGDEIMQTPRDLSTRDGDTVVMVTHDQQTANATDRIVRLFDGRQVH